MNITHKFTTDLQTRGITERIHAMQSDANTRVVEVTLLAGGEAWQVPEGISVSVAFRNLKDGHKGWYDKLPNGSDACAVDGNVITATLAPAVLSGDGEVLAAIVLQDADLNQLATFGFSILVEKNPAAGVSKHNDYYAYTTMEAVSEAVDAALDALDDTRAQLGQLYSYVNATLAQVSREAGAAIVCDSSGEAITVADASDRSLQGLTLYGKTTQNGTPTPDAPVALDSAGDSESIGVKVVGKNLLPNRTTTTTTNGVTFTVNADGSVTVNGTATTRTFFTISMGLLAELPLGSYRIVGCPKGGSGATYSLVDSYGGKFYDHGNGVTFNATAYSVVHVAIRIDEGMACNNLVFKPMVTQDMAATYADYEPYTEQTISIPTPNGLPGIPVASGGNYTDSNGQQWVCDEIDLARGVYVQRVDKYIYDGVARAIGTQSNGQKYCSFQIAGVAESTLFGNGVKVLSDRYKAWHWTDTDNGVYLVGGALVICDSRFVNSTTAKNILNEEQAVFLYILRTPIETPLDADTLAAYSTLHTNKTNTTVLNDANTGMAVSYAADTKTYIDNKFTELQSAIIAAGANI